MTVLAAALVDGGKLLSVVIASLVAGIGVTIAFAIGVHGALRFADMRRRGRAFEATAFATLAVAGVGVSIAAVGLGIYVMTQK